jgi:DNA-binding NarL/FixJ family response regulator
MKVLVVDDHALIRDALRHVLERLGHEVTVFEAGDCPHAFHVIDAQPDLDLVLLDLNLPGMHGVAALAELRRRYPAVSVVVVSAANDRASVTQALDRGAMGYIPKSSSNEVLASALRLVLSGGIYLPPEILGRAEPLAEPATASVESGGATAPRRVLPSDLGLTERQVQILILLMQGKSNKVICRELDLAESTVKNHVTHVLKTLNVTSRTQAVIAAARLGLVLEFPGRSGEDRQGANEISPPPR